MMTVQLLHAEKSKQLNVKLIPSDYHHCKCTLTRVNLQAVQIAFCNGQFPLRDYYLQGIMVVVFIILDWIFILTNTLYNNHDSLKTGLPELFIFFSKLCTIFWRIVRPKSLIMRKLCKLRNIFLAKNFNSFNLLTLSARVF